MLHLPFNHTITLIIITVIISLLAFSNQNVMNRLIFWPPAMQRGQFDRFITHGFIHADGTHLLFNMITLFSLAASLKVLSPIFLRHGLCLVLFGRVNFAILPSYLQHKNDANWASLGASGAVSAVLFAYILFQPWKLIFVFLFQYPLLFLQFFMLLIVFGQVNVAIRILIIVPIYGVQLTA